MIKRSEERRRSKLRPHECRASKASRKQWNVYASPTRILAYPFQTSVSPFELHILKACAALEPYLLQCKSSLTAEQCVELATVLCQSALEFGNVSFVAELCTVIIGIHFESFPVVFVTAVITENEEFQSAMADRLTDLISTFVMESDEKLDSLPDLLANLLITRWPRRYNHAVMDSNQILFTIISAAMGWQQLLLEASTEVRHL